MVNENCHVKNNNSSLVVFSIKLLPVFRLPMTSKSDDVFKERLFIFEDVELKDKLTIRTNEVLDSQYGFYTWPSAVVLAQYLWFHRKTLKDKNILEIGAGTALPGIMAALNGANVTLSDSSMKSKCLENCRRSCELNNLRDVAVIGIQWGRINKAAVDLKPMDIILGSDCFYDPSDFEDILFTIAYLLRKSNGKFWCTYQIRNIEWTIEDLLLKWNLKYRSIPLSTFDANNSDIGQSGLPGESVIEMFEITLANDVQYF